MTGARSDSSDPPIEIARLMLVTNGEEPTANELMKGWDELRIDRQFMGFWITPELSFFVPDKTQRDKLSTTPDWSGENLKIWILGAAEKP